LPLAAWGRLIAAARSLPKPLFGVNFSLAIPEYTAGCAWAALLAALEPRPGREIEAQRDDQVGEAADCAIRWRTIVLQGECGELGADRAD
jgi:hypothetical protein